MSALERLAEAGTVELWRRDGTFHVTVRVTGTSYKLSGASLYAVLRAIESMITKHDTTASGSGRGSVAPLTEDEIKRATLELVNREASSAEPSSQPK